MAKKKSSEENLKIIKYGDHTVKIQKTKTGSEALWIDGKRQKILESQQGYNLALDAYHPPYTSLIAAVEDYLQRLDSASK